MISEASSARTKLPSTHPLETAVTMTTETNHEGALTRRTFAGLGIAAGAAAVAHRRCDRPDRLADLVTNHSF